MKSKWRDSLWVDLTVAAAVTISVPLIAFLCWPVISGWMAPSPKGPVLVYEVDASLLPAGTTIDREQLAAVIDRCLNSGSTALAKVRPLEDGRVEVALMRDEEADVQEVERLLSHTATLEFRILANDWDDKALLDRAKADAAKAQVVDGDGKPLARWIPVKAGEESSIADYGDVVCRKKKAGQREMMEVLVVLDDEVLNGTHLKRVETNIDRRGRARLNLIFNTKGGQLCRKLTGSHLPPKGTNRNYKLGIIVDGELYSAPLIVSTIYDHAQIAGSFTKQEADDLAGRLNTGGLPARVRLVEKRNPS